MGIIGTLTLKPQGTFQDRNHLFHLVGLQAVEKDGQLKLIPCARDDGDKGIDLTIPTDQVGEVILWLYQMLPAAVRGRYRVEKRKRFWR